MRWLLIVCARLFAFFVLRVASVEEVLSRSVFVRRRALCSFDDGDFCLRLSANARERERFFVFVFAFVSSSKTYSSLWSLSTLSSTLLESRVVGRSTFDGEERVEGCLRAFGSGFRFRVRRDRFAFAFSYSFVSPSSSSSFVSPSFSNISSSTWGSGVTRLGNPGGHKGVQKKGGPAKKGNMYVHMYIIYLVVLVVSTFIPFHTIQAYVLI